MRFVIRAFAVCLLFGFCDAADATPLQDAARSGDVAQIKQLLAQGVDVNERAGVGTALWFATQEGHPEAAIFLIEHGADVDAVSRWGTPLHAAAAQGLADVAKLLLARGADPNARKTDKMTPLHVAAQAGHIEVVEILLEHGAEIDAVAMFNQPALHFAVSNGHLDVAELLRKRGTHGPTVVDVTPMLASADPVRGKKVGQQCVRCHTMDRSLQPRMGPPLWNIVGRSIANTAAYQYSSALKSAGGNWTYDDLNHYIAEPAWTLPGTNMKFDGLPSPQDRADLIVYLRSLSDTPAPLPN